ncbi:hypothetical protein D3C80_2086470 [compost metagenome]
MAGDWPGANRAELASATARADKVGSHSSSRLMSAEWQSGLASSFCRSRAVLMLVGKARVSVSALAKSWARLLSVLTCMDRGAKSSNAS